MLVLFLTSFLSAFSVMFFDDGLAGVSILSSILFVALWKNKKALEKGIK